MYICGRGQCKCIRELIFFDYMDLYKRAVYEVLREDGIKEHVFLLDEQLKIEGIGLVSQNLAEKRARLRASQSVLPRRH